jgi:hypothetical protein
MRFRPLTIIAAASLVLSIGKIALWVLSQFGYDSMWATGPSSRAHLEFHSAGGVLSVESVGPVVPLNGGWWLSYQRSVAAIPHCAAAFIFFILPAWWVLKNIRRWTRWPPIPARADGFESLGSL